MEGTLFTVKEQLRDVNTNAYSIHPSPISAFSTLLLAACVYQGTFSFKCVALLFKTCVQCAAPRHPEQSSQAMLTSSTAH
jgi:hypothetical protein